jgi:DNA-binding transcriptional MerR regulator
MDGYTISEVAERTGFSPSALRFYEQSGLVRPGRTPAGYRHYGEREVEALEFVGRAKGLGLSLVEIADLLALLGEERCEPVQDRLRQLVDEKIGDAHDRIAELVAFATELRAVAASLREHTPDGPCNDDCGCTTDGPHSPASSQPDTSIACTLDPLDVPTRVADWNATVARAQTVQPIEGGVRLAFLPEADVGQLVALATAEQDCCRFLTFTLTIGAATTLEVVGPADAAQLIRALVPVPA